MKPSGVVCDLTCGCAVPCPGGVSCRCASSGASAEAAEHKRCSCGEHCGCNPCGCEQSSNITGTGKSKCKCGPGCNCATCTA